MADNVLHHLIPLVYPHGHQYHYSNHCHLREADVPEEGGIVPDCVVPPTGLHQHLRGVRPGVGQGHDVYTCHQHGHHHDGVAEVVMEHLGKNKLHLSI